MINIVCALHCEAKALINHYRMSAVPGSLFPLFVNDELRLVVSGIGKVATSAAMTYVFSKMGESYNEPWINSGIAGHEDAEIGAWYNVNKITEQSTGFNWYPARTKLDGFENSGLLTVDQPVSSYQSNVLYDMEASAFMATALKLSSVELVQVMKVVSDNRENHHENIDKNRIVRLMDENIDPIISVIEYLKNKHLEYNAIYGVDGLYLSCLEKWRFSQYERKQLERLIQRWRLLGQQDTLASLDNSKNGKQVLTWFEAEINHASLVY